MKRQCLLHILIGRLDVRRLICFNHKAFLLNRLGKRKMRVGMNGKRVGEILFSGAEIRKFLNYHQHRNGDAGICNIVCGHIDRAAGDSSSVGANGLFMYLI